MAALRYGNAGVGRCGDARGDSGNDFESAAGLLERQRFFAAATEYEGIATFQAHDKFSSETFLHQQRIDVFLLHGVIICLFADVDHLAEFRRISPEFRDSPDNHAR